MSLIFFLSNLYYLFSLTFNLYNLETIPFTFLSLVFFDPE